MVRQCVDINFRRAGYCRSDDVFQNDVIVLVGRVTLAVYMVNSMDM